jgi:hypothetical protein
MKGEGEKVGEEKLTQESTSGSRIGSFWKLPS